MDPFWTGSIPREFWGRLLKAERVPNYEYKIQVEIDGVLTSYTYMLYKFDIIKNTYDKNTYDLSKFR